jgi:hypothetical protein
VPERHDPVNLGLLVMLDCDDRTAGGYHWTMHHANAKSALG